MFVPNKNFYEEFEIVNIEFKLKSNYNVAPGQEMPVVTMNSPKKLSEMKWGLIPFWTKNNINSYKIINARSEEIGLKPSFARSLRNKRCLIPASGFYEWDKKSCSKVPYLFTLKSDGNMVFAGLYDVWKGTNGTEICSYTILTTQANMMVGKIHDRMPVILEKQHWDRWADNSNFDPVLLDLLKPFGTGLMSQYKMDKKVNNPVNNYPELILDKDES